MYQLPFYRYVTGLSSVSPTSGSIHGGTAITLSGYGFGTDTSNVEVTVGSGSCEINEVAMGTLKCTTPAHQQGAVNVVVCVKNILYIIC